jgi:hypothetical protein
MVSCLLFLIVVSAAAPHSVHTSDAPAFFLLPLHINSRYIVATLSNLSNPGQKNNRRVNNLVAQIELIPFQKIDLTI